MPDNNLPQKVYDLERKIEDSRRYTDERIRMHDHNGNDAQRVNADDLLGDVEFSVTTNEAPRSRVYVGGAFTMNPTTIVSNTTNAGAPFSFFEFKDGAIEGKIAGEAGLRMRASTGGSLQIDEGAGLGTLSVDISASKNPHAWAIMRVTSGVTDHYVDFGFTDYATGGTGTLHVVPTDGIFFRTSADTNWQAVTRSSGTETATDTGVAVSSSNYQLLEITVSGSLVIFKINNSVVATHTTNIPTVDTLGLNVCNVLINNTASGVRYNNVTEMHGWWDQYSF